MHIEGKNTTGYDVIANGYVDMLEAGIIDPAKVTRSAVENACSIAAMILSTSALVTDIPEPETPMPGGGDMNQFGIASEGKLTEKKGVAALQGCIVRDLNGLIERMGAITVDEFEGQLRELLRGSELVARCCQRRVARSLPEWSNISRRESSEVD